MLELFYKPAIKSNHIFPKKFVKRQNGAKTPSHQSNDAFTPDKVGFSMPRIQSLGFIFNFKLFAINCKYEIWNFIIVSVKTVAKRGIKYNTYTEKQKG